MKHLIALVLALTLLPLSACLGSLCLAVCKCFLHFAKLLPFFGQFLITLPVFLIQPDPLPEHLCLFALLYSLPAPALCQ